MPVVDRPAERTSTGAALDAAPRSVRMEVFARHVLDACGDAVYVLTPDLTRFAYVNRAAARQTGFPRARLMTMTPCDLSPTLEIDGLRGLVGPLVRGEAEVIRTEQVLRTADGRAVDVEIDLTFLTRPTDQRHVVAVVRDVSRRAEAEAERLAADRARLATELHDRTVTQLFAAGLTLHGVATRLADADPDAVDRITDAVDRIDEAIRQLRASVFARSSPTRGPVDGLT